MASTDRGSQHRLRLLEGMSVAVARKGYADVTIADVVAEAGVSKRTFYEHFSSKQDCLLACYVQATGALMAAIRQQVGLRIAGADGLDTVADRSLIPVTLSVYLNYLDRSPQLAATLLIEVQRAGAEGRAIYRRNNLEFATLIHESVSRAAAGRRLAFDLSQSIALVGGVNELLLNHAEDHPEVPFSTLRPTVLRFVEAVIGVDSERVSS